MAKRRVDSEKAVRHIERLRGSGALDPARIEEARRPLELAQEARRQSLLVRRRRSERETLEFVEQTADTRGWK